MNRLAIFDVDGTLTDTNKVDDDCYRTTIAEALGVTGDAVDWSGAAHVTDSEIFRWLCAAHRRSEPSADEMARARSQFVERLTAQLEQAPARFGSIAGQPRCSTSCRRRAGRSPSPLVDGDLQRDSSSASPSSRSTTLCSRAPMTDGRAPTSFAWRAIARKRFTDAGSIAS